MPAHKLLCFALKREMRRLDYVIPKEDNPEIRTAMRKRLNRVEQLIIRLRLPIHVRSLNVMRKTSNPVNETNRR